MRSAELPPGPSCYPEVFEFMDFLVPRLLDGHDEPVKFWHGQRVQVTSRWSGIGRMDIALQLWASSMRDQGCSVVIETYSFTEWNSTAQNMLSRCPCQHMFSNSNCQFSPGLRDRIVKKQRELREEFIGQTRRGCGLKVAEKALLKQRLTENFKCFVEMTLAACDDPVVTHAECLIHGIHCPLIPDSTSLWIDVGSPSCKAWSPRGHRLGWLSEDNVDTLLWAFSIARRDGRAPSVRCPDIVFGEEVPDFDLQFWKSLCPGFKWHSTIFGPADAGLPILGDRLWWVGLSSDLVLSCEQPFAPDRVESSIVRRVVATPEIFMRASCLQLEEHENLINTHGARLSAHPRGKRARASDYLSTCGQLRLEEHRNNAISVRSRFPSLHEVPMYFDISQHVSHSGTPNGFLPRPTTSSAIWSEARSRMVHPLEVWSSQGPPSTQILNCIC